MKDFEPEIISSTLKNLEVPDSISLETSEREGEHGDVVGFTVVKEGGSYDRVEKVGGQTLKLEEGMRILGVLCERKAVKGFNGEIPDKVKSGDILDFIGGGGVVGRCISKFEELGEPYQVRFEGFLTDGNGEKVNVEDFSHTERDHREDWPELIMVSGTRMDSGKTTLAANIISELSDRGYRIGAAKLTGFTRQRDRLKMEKYGALKSMDFVDAGILTTSIDTESVVEAGKNVLDRFSDEEFDAVVVELGGGLIGFDNVKEVLLEDEMVENTVFSAVTVMDPVAAYGTIELVGSERVDLFSGPATDTETGESLVENAAGKPALNGRKSYKEITDMVEERL